MLTLGEQYTILSEKHKITLVILKKQIDYSTRLEEEYKEAVQCSQRLESSKFDFLLQTRRCLQKEIDDLMESSNLVRSVSQQEQPCCSKEVTTVIEDDSHEKLVTSDD